MNVDNVFGVRHRNILVDYNRHINNICTAQPVPIWPLDRLGPEGVVR